MPSKGSKDLHRTKDQRCILDQGGPFAALGMTFGMLIETDQDSDDLDLGKCDVILPAAVHQLLSRKEMMACPEALRPFRRKPQVWKPRILGTNPP